MEHEGLRKALTKIHMLQVQVKWYSYEWFEKEVLYQSELLSLRNNKTGRVFWFWYFVPESQWNRGKENVFGYKVENEYDSEEVQFVSLQLGKKRIRWTRVSLIPGADYQKLTNWDLKVEATREKLQRALCKYHATLQELATSSASFYAVPSPVMSMVMYYVYPPQP